MKQSTMTDGATTTAADLRRRERTLRPPVRPLQLRRCLFLRGYIPERKEVFDDQPPNWSATLFSPPPCSALSLSLSRLSCPWVLPPALRWRRMTKALNAQATQSKHGDDPIKSSFARACFFARNRSLSPFSTTPALTSSSFSPPPPPTHATALLQARHGRPRDHP